MKGCKLKLIIQSQNGRIYKCNTCDKIHIEFKNLNFTFNDHEFRHFKNYFIKLDAKHWEEVNRNTAFVRRILIPVGHKNLTTTFNIEEISEIKSLFRRFDSKKYKPEILSMNKLEATYSVN